MAAEDLARIYMRIDDDDNGASRAVAAGDFSGVGEADLDDTSVVCWSTPPPRRCRMWPGSRWSRG